MILTDLFNTMKKLWEKISFDKHFNNFCRCVLSFTCQPYLLIMYMLKARYHYLSYVILRLSNNIIIMYFDRYLSCFGIKIQIVLGNLLYIN